MQRFGVDQHAVEVEDDRRDHFGRSEQLAGAHRDRQPVLAWRHRTVVGRVEDAERMVGAVEVEIVDARRRPLEIEVAPAGVGIRPVRQVVKRHEETPQLGVGGFGKCRQLERLPLQA